MKSWTSIRIILFFMLAAACSRNPLGEDLSQQIVNLGFRLSQTCTTSFNQDTALNCPIATDEVIAGLVWTLEPGTTCTWATINASTGIISGTPNDNNVGSCNLTVGAKNTKRKALALNIPVTVINVAPVFTPIANAASILEDSPLTLIRTDTDVQTTEEGFGTYGFAHVSTTAPRCFDNAIALSIDPLTGAISYQPAANYFGTCYIKASFDDGNLQANSIVTSEFSITVLPVNDAPIIGLIANQSTLENTSLPVTLNVNDVDNVILCSNINLSATSSDLTIVNAASFSFSGTAPNCVLTINPIPYMSGPLTVSVTVTDGLLSASTSFNLNVIAVPNPPVISLIANQTTNEDNAINVNFTITDPDSILTCAGSMSATSSNTILLPLGNIVFSGTAPNCSALLTPAANQNGLANLVFTVSDGALTATSSFSFTVIAVNDAPVISSITNKSTNEDTPLAVNFTISDVDNVLNCSTSVAATSSNAGLLPVANIIFSGTAPNCTATLNPLADQNGITNLSLIVSDGALTATSSFSFTVIAVNDAPVISSITNKSTNEDTPLAVNFTISDVDNVLNCSTSVAATSSNAGLLPVANIIFSGTAPNCTATLNPLADQNGITNLTLIVSDGALTATSSFSFTVIPVNDAPVISIIGNQVTNEDTPTAALPFTITDVDSILLCNSSNVTASSSDITLLPLSQIVIGGTAPNCTVTMSPALNRNGSVNVVITVSDNGTPSLQATSSFSLFVNAVNDPPVISTIAAQSTNESTPLNVSFIISDVDNALVCNTDVSATSSDGVLLPTSSITFSGTAPNCVATLSPTFNLNGSTNLVFIVTDGVLTASSSFTLTVIPYNDPPVISAISNQTVNEDNLILVNYTITDIDSPLSCSSSMSITTSNPGLVPLSNVTFLGTAPNCTLSINPAANQNGIVNFVVTVTDGSTPVSTSFSLTVTPVNDPPVISAVANQTTSEDTTTAAIPFTITDVDNILSCTTSVSATSSNTVLLPVANIVFAGTAPNCTVTMTPTANSNGGSTVAITVTDGVANSTSTFNLTVTPVNDAPVISLISNQTIAEDAATAAIPFTITDIDSILLCTSANLSATSSNSTMLPVANIVFGGAAPNCTVTMTPVANGNGVSNVVITVFDNGTPNLQATSLLSLTVTPVNDAPVISAIGNITINEDTSATAVPFTITDVDNTLSCTTSVSVTSSNGILIPVSNIIISGTAPNCLLSLTPLANANGLANIVLTVTDGSLTATSPFTLMVTPVNDPPVISAISAKTTTEGVPINVPFTISDVDSTLTCGTDVTATSSNGTLLPVASITFSGTAPSCTATLTPVANTNGATNIVFTVSDGFLTASSAFTLTVIAYDDPPVISAVTNKSINEDTSLAFAFTITDIDSVLNCTTSMSATSSDSVLVPVGNIVFSGTAPNCMATLNPALNQNGVTNIVFTVTDGTTPVSRSFSLTVFAVNDAPVISAVANQTIAEDTSTGALAVTITDVDNILSCTTSMSATTSNPALLPLTNIVFAGTAPNCTVTMTPVANGNGVSSVVLTVTDGSLNATSPVNLTVTAVNDAPVISAITNQTIAEDTTTAAIPFTITDVDSILLCTSANLSVTSSNTTLLPLANIVFGGTAPNCTVTMMPVADGFGFTNVVITVLDNGTPNLQATSPFTLTVTAVNDAPVISAIANQTILEDFSTGALAFTITDVDNILSCTTSMSATSSNTALLPLTNIVFAGTAPNCTVTMTPVANGNGVSNVVVTVTDGLLNATSPVTLTVTAVNDPPVISTLPARSTVEGVSITVNFTITDVDNTLSCLTSMSATSSDSVLLPVANITFSGTAPSCVATLSPALNTNGVSNVAFFVTDGTATTSNGFAFTVTPVNDPPVITAISNQTTNEDTSTGAIAFTITDVDSVLSCTTSMSATSSNTTLIPVANIVFAGTAPNCTVTLTPALNANGATNIVLTVTDGTTPVTSPFSVTVTPVNDAPVISAIANQTILEDFSTGALAFTITDVDNILSCTTSMSATSSNPTLLPLTNIVFAGTAPNCTVTMTPVANGNGVSNVVVTVTDGLLNATSPVTLTVTPVNDAPVISAIANQTIAEDTVTAAIPFTITDVDSVLSCTTSMSATSSNTTLIPLANIVFAGTAPNCTVTMTPVPDGFGTSNIILTVTDGLLNATSPFTLTVTPVNDAPVISAITNQTTNEDTSSGAVAFTITDVDNALSCTTSISATSSNTTMLPVASIVFAGTAPNCTVTMMPALNQNGASNVVLTVTDGLLNATSPFTLTVTPVNDAPVISAITNKTTMEDTPIIGISFIITDVDSVLNCSTSMSATSSDATLLPVANIVFGGIAPNCTVSLNPALNQNGVSNVVLTVTDGSLLATSAFSFTVTAVNDPPIISAIINQTTNEDTATAAIPFTIMDVDSVLSCTTSMSATSSNTTLIPVANIIFAGTAPNCTVTLTPALNANGATNIVLTVTDGTTPVTSSFSVTVTPVNDAPVISAITNQTTNEDTSSGAVAFTITDVDNALSCTTSMSATSSNTTMLPVANIVFAGTAPNCTVTMMPALNQNGASNVVLTVTDGLLNATSAFVLNVTPVNDAPVISVIANQTIAEDTVTAAIPFTITDVDSVLSCTTSMSATSSNTTLIPAANIVFAGTAPNCTVTMTPVPDGFGTSNIILTVTDGLLNATSPFTLTVTPVNDAPVISAITNQTTNEDTSSGAVAFTITDVDNALSCTTSMSATSSNTTLLPVASIVFAGTAPNCTVTMMPALNQSGASNVVLTVTDGLLNATSPFTLTVTPVNDAPVISVIANQTIAEDTVTAAIPFTITDVDSVLSCTTSMSATSSNTALIPVANIVFAGTAPNCTVTMTPVANGNGVSNIVLTVTDGFLNAASAFSLTVTPVNDPPVISAIGNQSTNEDVPTSPIPFTITDIDSVLNCTASMSATSSDTTVLPVANIVFGGTAPNCTVTMTSGTNQNGTSNVVIKVTDGGGLFVTTSFVLTAVAVNDPPVISALTNQTTAEGSDLIINFTITDIDSILMCTTMNLAVTSSNTTLIPVANVVYSGTAPNCTATITPGMYQNGTSNLVITVMDNGTPNLQATSAFTVIVTPVNDPPVLYFIADKTILEDNTAIVNFTITDVDSILDCVTSMTATSTNTALIPDANIVFSGTAPNCTATITPVANGFGLSDLLFTVSDTIDTNNRVFTITVTAVNDPPVMSLIANQTLKTDSTTVLNYTLTDVDNTMNCLTSVTVSSATTSVIANADIVKGGTAPNCKLTVSPSLNVAGSSLISVAATDGMATTTSTFTISTIKVNSIAVTPTPFSLVGTGSTQQVLATATYSDSSTANITTATGATWTSSATGIATVNNAGSKGLVTSAAGSGNVNITIAYKTVSAVAAITVYQVTGITVSQSVITGGIGSAQTVTAQAILSPSGTSDITGVSTWTSSNSGVASVSGGVITLNAAGSATVTASYAGYSQTISVTVQNKTLSSIAITPGSSSVAVNGTQNFVATATYSDASSQIVTNSATWSSSNAGVASVSNTAPSIGRATGIATGSVTITAAIGGVSGNATLSITAATLSSIAITPYDALVASSGSFQFTATGTFSDATTSNITDQVTWNSSTTTAATVSNAVGSRGLVTTPSFAGYRSTTLTATLGGVSGTSPLGVNGATVSSILVTPTVTLTAGSTYNLKAYANLSDGGTVDVTDFAVWSSATTAAVTVSNGVGNKGLVTGVAAGSSSISAVYSGVTGLRTVTVSGSASVVDVGTGLTGDYYTFTGGTPPTNPFIAGNKKGSRLDAQVNFNWGTGAAPMGVSDLFAVRWTGFFVPTSATTYFCLYSDDGMRMSINGTQIINSWTDHLAQYDCSVAVNLTVGTKYPILIEYYEGTGSSEAHVTSSPTSAAAAQSLSNAIPQSQLYPQ